MLDREQITLSIKQYSDQISSLMLQDISKLADDQFSELTQRQMTLLELLGSRSLTIGEIATHFAYTPSAASQLIKKLEKSGYVRREINPSNRREIIVSLEEKGLQYKDKISELDMYIIQKYYNKLSDEDLQKLLELYEKLLQISIAQNEQY